MNTVTQTLPAQLLSSAAAANADQLGEQRRAVAPEQDGTGTGWDAYEVWRRFIKDARDRRQHQE